MTTSAYHPVPVLSRTAQFPENTVISGLFLALTTVLCYYAPCMRAIAFIVACCMAAFPAAAAAGEAGLAVKGVRFFSYPGFTRIVFETETAASYVITRAGDGRSLYFSSYGGPFSLKAPQLPAVNDGVVKGLEFRHEGDHRAIIINLAPAAGESKDFVLRGPDRIVVDIMRGSTVTELPGRAADRPLLVVLDPGHGGSHAGVAAPGGTEKALALDLALAVRKALKRSGAKITVTLTRDQDAAPGPDERAAAANAARPAAFVSIHASQGTESRVFILDPDEGHAVNRGGSGSGDFLGFDAVSEQQQALWGSQQASYAQESGRLGRAVLRALTGQDTAEPVQAPLLQLRSVAAAAVLVEVGTGQSRTQTAEAIARGIEQYVLGK